MARYPKRKVNPGVCLTAAGRLLSPHLRDTALPPQSTAQAHTPPRRDRVAPVLETFDRVPSVVRDCCSARSIQRFFAFPSSVRLEATGARGPTDRRLKPPGQNWKLEKRCLAIGNTFHFKDHDQECRGTLDSVVTSVKCIIAAYYWRLAAGSNPVSIDQI